MKLADIENAIIVNLNRMLGFKASEVFFEKKQESCEHDLVVIFEGIEYRKCIPTAELVRASKTEILDYLQDTIESLVYKIKGSSK